MLKSVYENYILKYPRIVFLLLVVMIAFLGYQATYLEFDVSTESLILEDDDDLRYTREITDRYGSSDFLVVVYTPSGYLLSDEVLKDIAALKADLLELELVESVRSILDVPLLQSPPKSIVDLVKDVPTLETPGIDRNLVKNEFLNSPIYENLLVSKDFKTTVLLVNLKEDVEYNKLLNRRNKLREKELDGVITDAEKTELSQVIKEFKIHRGKSRKINSENIAAVRAIQDKYRKKADVFLGGASMIADDMITFLKNDLATFGTGVLVFLIILLFIIFRRFRWIIIPILCCAFSVIATSGLLGMFDWEVTVISSNFISIQLIITMAMTIHLIVRYREMAAESPDLSQKELVLNSTLAMAQPCAFAVLTTIAGFASLIISDILPIQNFGWMMSAGVAVSLFIVFVTFPIVLMLMEKTVDGNSSDDAFPLTKILANFTEKKGRLILGLSGLLLLLSIGGSSRLIVENSFIDYFKESTEIYQGMKMIDEKLGGTMPLDIILDFDTNEVIFEETAKPENGATVEEEAVSEEDEDEDDELDEDFDEEFADTENDAQYWFTPGKMELIEKVHDYLDSLPEIGKVQSLATLLKVGRTLNEGESLDNLLLALAYNELPEDSKSFIMTPYISIENNQARFSVRTIDSDPNLRRNVFIKKVQRELHEIVGLKIESYRLTSFVILYNNMLQSLFNSQILTLGTVLFALMFMFMFLFRSIKISLIAIIPNALSVGVVLGFMGWVGIPLDLMTITIAAISVGIAVDDTIHYIHRFIKEFNKDRNYLAAMHRCHESIGHAMYYTSVTIIIGFSILIFSNFIPSIYFGLLTGLAMFIALIAALTLLPQLIIILKPLGPEGIIDQE